MPELICEAAFAQTMELVVEPALAAMRQQISMPLAGGGTLHAEIYTPETARRAVVILHGYTESGEKFREMTWYFLKAGYSVFVPDHRGHGHSVREVEDTSVTHVDEFGQYVQDAGQFLKEIVLPRTCGLPLCLYAHSMGGAIGAMLLMEHPYAFTRAVLTAPMIAPSTAPFPGWVARLMAQTMCALGKSRERAFVGKPFDPARETFERSFATSRARFDYYEQKRIRYAHLQNCAPTYGWVREATGVTRTLLKPENAARIATPLLLCQAARDTVVQLPPQNAFVRLLKDAQLQAFDARHEIYCSQDSVMGPYVDAVLNFLGQ